MRGARRKLLVKGAPESVLQRCTHVMLADGTIAPLTAAVRKNISAAVDEMAQQAWRCLACAVRTDIGDLPDLTDPANFVKVEEHMVFVGAVGMQDPPRAEVKQSMVECKCPRSPRTRATVSPLIMRTFMTSRLNEGRLPLILTHCMRQHHLWRVPRWLALLFRVPDTRAPPPRATTGKQAGIRVIVITGDNKITAEAICRSIGVFDQASPLSYPAPAISLHSHLHTRAPPKADTTSEFPSWGSH